MGVSLFSGIALLYREELKYRLEFAWSFSLAQNPRDRAHKGGRMNGREINFDSRLNPFSYKGLKIKQAGFLMKLLFQIDFLKFLIIH
jgi:hypothetical protein